MRLQGKVALVTGSTSGIGEGIAEGYAREGANVIVSGRSETRGKQVVEKIRAAGGTATFVAADLSSKTDVDRLIKEATEAFGQIDILVNNAAIYPMGPSKEFDEATYDAVMDTNVKGPFFLTVALLEQMAKRTSGKVINITTGAGYDGLPGAAIYGSSKAALTQMTRSLAAEYGPSGININSIVAGVTDTPGTAHLSEFMHQIASIIPARRHAQPIDVVGAAVFLASDDADYIHGADLAVDGGYLAV